MVADMRVGPGQRFNRHNPCPICDGAGNDRRGTGNRDWGFLSADGRYACCTNSLFANGLPLNPRTNAYHHKLDGPCNCGETHSLGAIVEREPAKIIDFTPRPVTRLHQRYAPISTHEYREADGALRFRVIRLWSQKAPGGRESLPKCIPQRPDGAGDWIDGLGDMEYRGLYRLPELIAADPWEPVFIPEGEKCVEAVVALGGVATCNAGGAGKWQGAYSEYFTGRQVVILSDPDEPGRAHAASVASYLQPVATSVRIIELDGGDVADWLDAGHSYAELRRLAAQSPIISAHLPPARESNLAMQDGRAGESQKTCPTCMVLRDKLRMAETSLDNLRRERAIESRCLRMPTAKWSAPVKLAAVVVRREIKTPTQTRPHNADGLERVYRAAIADQLGCSDQAAGTYLRKLGDSGFIARKTVNKGFHDSETFIGEGPLFDNPEKVPEPERANSWGGHRVKACPDCKSTDLDHLVRCRGCGAIHDPKNLIDMIVGGECPEQAQPDAQEIFPPENPIVGNLANHADAAQADTGDELPADILMTMPIPGMKPTPRAPASSPDRCIDGHSHRYVVGECLVCGARKAVS